MAKTVWHRIEDLAAFAQGQQAARRGASRVPPEHYLSYNERAAFNDGWDSVERERRKRPRPRQADGG